MPIIKSKIVVDAEMKNISDDGRVIRIDDTEYKTVGPGETLTIVPPADVYYDIDSFTIREL